MRFGHHRRRNVPKDTAKAVHEALTTSRLARSKRPAGATWRLRVDDTDIAYWASTGTLWGTLSPSASQIVGEAWELIAALTDSPFVEPTKPILVGLDESGTTEPVGPPVMVAAILPSALAARLWDVVEFCDTKGKRHQLRY